MNDLEGKKVLVTAGASGIGMVIASSFRSHGADVVITDIDEVALDRATRAHGFVGHHGDSSDDGHIRALRAQVENDLGELDILINNAGVAGPTGPVETLDLGAWKTTLYVNITGHFLHVKHFVDLLRQSSSPSIVNLSSVAGLHAFPGRAAYAASKWAVIGFSKTLAAELGPDGIRVNVVCPGSIEGPRTDEVIAAKAAMLERPLEEIRRAYNRMASLGRMSSAEDIANMTLFAASDLARNVSGQILTVDGHTEKLT